MPEPSLTNFLSARIAEDERYATEANQRKGGGVQGWFYFDGDLGDGYLWHSYQPEFKDPPDTGLPARVLAECEAKTKIIELHGSERYDDVREPWCRTCGNPGGYPCRTLKLLALPYADHPDYDETWRPE